MGKWSRIRLEISGFDLASKVSRLCYMICTRLSATSADKLLPTRLAINRESNV